jgi:hypothetical protein
MEKLVLAGWGVVVGLAAYPVDRFLAIAIQDNQIKTLSDRTAWKDFGPHFVSTTSPIYRETDVEAVTFNDQQKTVASSMGVQNLKCREAVALGTQETITVDANGVKTTGYTPLPPGNEENIRRLDMGCHL